MSILRNVLITGTSSGIGYGLAKELCQQGVSVYGISRRESDLSSEYTNYNHILADLVDFKYLPELFANLFSQGKQFDLVVLNAGILGTIGPFDNQSLESSMHVMDINVWANKTIIDLFLKHQVEVKQYVAISSGAAKNGSAGWGSYSVSKAALNMLIQTYAAENPSSHFCTLAPGLIDTAMQDYISSLESNDKMPSIARLKSAKGTSAMPDPIKAAPILLDAMCYALSLKSGEFIDVRDR